MLGARGRQPRRGGEQSVQASCVLCRGWGHESVSNQDGRTNSERTRCPHPHTHTAAAAQQQQRAKKHTHTHTHTKQNKTKQSKSKAKPTEKTKKTRKRGGVHGCGQATFTLQLLNKVCSARQVSALKSPPLPSRVGSLSPCIHSSFAM